jgi:hypothetical protein
MAKRVYFGNLRLHSHARFPVAQEDRANQVSIGLGVDRDVALHVPSSPNVSGGFEVTTYGEPHAAQSQEAWIEIKESMREAIRARMAYGFPLVWCADDSYNRVVDHGAGVTYFTTAAHGFVTGDYVYFYRPTTETDRAALHWFGWGKVTSTPTSSSFVVDADPSSSDYAPDPGDVLVRVSSLWTPLYAGAIRPIAPQGGPKGDFYHGAIVWPFVGIPSTRIGRVGASAIA